MSHLHEDQYNDYQRYLASKRSVDDRSLNQQVWWLLRDIIDSRTSTGFRDRPFRVLELGSGIGTMVERIWESQLLPGRFGVQCEYVAVDELAANSETAAAYLADWGAEERLTVEQQSSSVLSISSGCTISGSINLHLETADLFDYLARAAAEINSGAQQPFDLVIAHAFLDLVDAEEALAQIKATMRPYSLLFTSINFDGATILQPEIDPAFDAHIEHLYHQTMDERIINGKRSGDSKTGRHLFGHLQQAGFEVTQAGASDWVVFAYPTGIGFGTDYAEDEAYFLHFIVETMHGALADHPAIDDAKFRAWVAKRHQQIEERELIYIAHQLDFLAIVEA